MSKYAVRVRDGRWLNYCDECWYETIEFPKYQYTKEEAMAIAKQMQNHYVYKCWIENADETIVVDRFAPKEFTSAPKVERVATEKPKPKFGIKFNLKKK